MSMKQVSDGFRRFLVGKPPQVSNLAGNFLFPGEHHEHEWLFLGGFFGAPVSITIAIRCGILIYGICLFLMGQMHLWAQCAFPKDWDSCRKTSSRYGQQIPLAVFPAKVGCFNQLKEVEPGNRALSGLKQTFNLPKQVDKRCNQWAQAQIFHRFGKGGQSGLYNSSDPTNATIVTIDSDSQGGHLFKTI